MNAFKLTSTLCLSIVSLSLRAQIIVNGGLELQPPDTTIRTVLPGITYAGWTSTGPGDVEFCGPTILGPAFEGQGVVDLNGVAFQGGISQTLNTRPGVSYLLT